MDIKETNEEGLELFLKSLENKKNKDHNESYTYHAKMYVEYLTTIKNKPYYDAKDVLDEYFVSYMPKKNLLATSAIILQGAQGLKQFYTYLWMINKMSFDEYGPVFDQLDNKVDQWIADSFYQN